MRLAIFVKDQLMLQTSISGTGWSENFKLVDGQMACLLAGLR
jgi:hypothetical protein